MSEWMSQPRRARRVYFGLGIGLIVVLAAGAIVASWLNNAEQREQARSGRDETELIVTNFASARVRLFRAGRSLQEATEFSSSGDQRLWMPPGRYFLEADQQDRIFFFPIPLRNYRGGPETDGAFAVTVRSTPKETPPLLFPDLPQMAYVPSGHFLLGDRLNPREPHYVWAAGFFISPFEVTNAEFGEFLKASQGYRDPTNWTEGGKQWRASNASRVSALLAMRDSDFGRFGRPELPVVQVNWFEANAYCHWLTRMYGQEKWIFALPSEAEWEKAARGPDNFDYGLGMTISDDEVRLYNWKKNPDAKITVVGFQESQSNYRPNRYGLYHMSGNVAEWTQSIHRAYNKEHPYVDDDRNGDNTAGLRVVRGGSWYSASTAILYLPYRETFQPEVSAPYLGFRVIARRLP
jgi:formylglycine-generating enzyme required for sulfatase activity